MRRQTRLTATATAIAGACALAVSPPAEAHPQRDLAAKILTATAVCDELTAPVCHVRGKVRVTNNRPKSTGKILICVGIDVFSGTGRNLSIEPPSMSGQGAIDAATGRSRITRYKTLYDASSGTAKRVVVTHVHKHLVHGSGGRLC